MSSTWPGLTSHRHSELIGSDSEYFRICFSAVHYLIKSEQRWFSSEQRWKRKISERRISAETVLIFPEWQFLVNFSIFEIFRSTTNLKNIIQIFSPICDKKWTKNFSCSIFWRAKGITNLEKLGFLLLLSSKTDVVQFFKIFFPSTGMKFQNYFKKLELLLSLFRNLGRFTIFETKKAILVTTLTSIFTTSDFVIIISVIPVWGKYWVI